MIKLKQRWLMVRFVVLKRLMNWQASCRFQIYNRAAYFEQFCVKSKRAGSIRGPLLCFVTLSSNNPFCLSCLGNAYLKNCLKGLLGEKKFNDCQAKKLQREKLQKTYGMVWGVNAIFGWQDKTKPTLTDFEKFDDSVFEIKYSGNSVEVSRTGVSEDSDSRLDLLRKHRSICLCIISQPSVTLGTQFNKGAKV